MGCGVGLMALILKPNVFINSNKKAHYVLRNSIFKKKIIDFGNHFIKKD